MELRAIFSGGSLRRGLWKQAVSFYVQTRTWPLHQDPNWTLKRPGKTLKIVLVALLHSRVKRNENCFIWTNYKLILYKFDWFFNVKLKNNSPTNNINKAATVSFFLNLSLLDQPLKFLYQFGVILRVNAFLTKAMHYFEKA